MFSNFSALDLPCVIQMTDDEKFIFKVFSIQYSAIPWDLMNALIFVLFVG